MQESTETKAENFTNKNGTDAGTKGYVMKADRERVTPTRRKWPGNHAECT